MAQSLKILDWRSLRKYLDPKVSGDLNAFLKNLPQNAGQGVLIAAGIAWSVAAVLGIYAGMQAHNLADIRVNLKETQALSPILPHITDVPIEGRELEAFVKDIAGVYKGLDIQAQGSSMIITAGETLNYAAFREAIGHIQNGGSGWRVTLDRLCVGRECEGAAKLTATLKVNKVSVENPVSAGAGAN